MAIAFGWWIYTPYDSLGETTLTKSYPYAIIGSHEDGLPGGCSGCIVSKVKNKPVWHVCFVNNLCFSGVKSSSFLHGFHLALIKRLIFSRRAQTTLINGIDVLKVRLPRK